MLQLFQSKAAAFATDKPIGNMARDYLHLITDLRTDTRTESDTRHAF